MPPAQDPVPLHSTSQRPAPQVIGPPHDALSLHVISHRLAPVQSTPDSQALVPSQCTSHGIPAGQTTRSEQAPVPSHSMMQVSRWQLSHASGHAAASPGAPSDAELEPSPPAPPSLGAVTHQPSTHALPSAQSAVPLQRKSSERAAIPHDAAPIRTRPSANRLRIRREHTPSRLASRRRRRGLARAVDQAPRNRLHSILSLRMRARSVCGLIPSTRAAP